MNQRYAPKLTKDQALEWLVYEFTATYGGGRHKAYGDATKGVAWIARSYILAVAIFLRDEAHEQRDWVRCMGLQTIIDNHNYIEIGCDADELGAASDMINTDETWKPVLDVLRMISIPASAQPFRVLFNLNGYRPF